jgi:hypothetical protein
MVLVSCNVFFFLKLLVKILHRNACNDSIYKIYIKMEGVYVMVRSNKIRRLSAWIKFLARFTHRIEDWNFQICCEISAFQTGNTHSR